jgi:exosortase N
MRRINNAGRVLNPACVEKGDLYILPILLYAILLIYISLRSNLNLNFSVIIGFLLLPYVWTSNLENRRSNRWLVVVVLLSIACWYLSIVTLYYWLAVMALVFAFESLRTRLTILPIALLFTISMIFRYLSEVFTFPIRIWLSRCVGELLKFCQFDIQVSGNNIVLNGSDFSVEPACMGLDMMGVSLMMSIFLIAFYQKKTKRNLPDLWIILILILTFGINILNNFFRMMLLIILKISPGNPFHEIVGLLCFLVYVCVPLAYLIGKVFSVKTTVARSGTSRSVEYSDSILEVPIRSTVFLHLFLSFFISFIIISGMENIRNRQQNESANVLKQFDVKQIRTDKALIYIKQIPAFYSVEHSPLFCWRGSGYELKNINEIVVNGHKIYTGFLIKGNEKLLTAWWFTDGNMLTNSQLAWRWRSFLNNKSFQLVNITANSEADLKSEVKNHIN